MVLSRGHWLTPLLLGLLLGRATVLAAAKPFGTAFVITLAALGMQTRALVATLGAVIGDALSPPAAGGLPAWPVLLVAWCVTAAAGRWFRLPPAVVALGALLGAASLRFVEAAFTGGGWDMPALASVSETLAVVALFPAVGLLAARPAELGRGQMASVLAAAGLLVMGTEGLEMYGLAVSAVLMRTLLLIAAAAGRSAGPLGGMGAGAAAGTMMSVLAVLGTGLWRWPAAVLAPAGLLAGLGASLGRIGAVAGLFIAHLLLSPYAADGFEIAAALTESLAAAALAALVPRAALDQMAALVPDTPEARRARQERRRRAETAARRELRKISAALQDVGRRLGAPRSEDAGERFGRFVLDVADDVCAGCPHHAVCWSTHVYSTYRDLLQTAAAAADGGSVRPDDLPDGLRRRCIQPERLAAGVSRMLAAMPRWWPAAAAQEAEFDVYSVVQRQLAGIGAVLAAVADRVEWRAADAGGPGPAANARLAGAPDEAGNARETGAPLTTGHPGKAATELLLDRSAYGPEPMRNAQGSMPPGGVAGPSAGAPRRKPRYCLVVDVARAAAAGSSVSGDAFRRVDLPGHRVVLGLSDGMGTGPRAAVESEAAVAMLERLLLEGFDLAFAAQIINLILLLRSPGESFATLDVCSFDLCDGSMQLLKTGAPPTYIRRAAHVDVVRADSLPIGILQAVETSVVEYRLHPGDTVVMVTDGALETGSIGADKAEALARALRRLEPGDPRETAAELLKRVQAGPDQFPRDDVTVVAARLLPLRPVDEGAMTALGLQREPRLGGDGPS